MGEMTQTEIFTESRKILDNMTFPPCETKDMRHEFEFVDSRKVLYFTLYSY